MVFCGGGKGTNLEVDQPTEKIGDEIWSVWKWRGEDGGKDERGEWVCQGDMVKPSFKWISDSTSKLVCTELCTASSTAAPELVSFIANSGTSALQTYPEVKRI